jgi:hypothetical protein
VNCIEGCIQTYPKDAAQIAEALREGPVMFSWTDGSTQYDLYMVPVSSFKTRFEAPEKIHRWFSYDHVIVGIERKGCFFFDLLSGTQAYSPEYVAEKLGLDPMEKDSAGVAHLFNMIVEAGKKFGRNIVI